MSKEIEQVLNEAKAATHLVCPHCQGHVEFPKPIDNIMNGVFMGLGNAVGNMAAAHLMSVRQAELLLRKAGYKISRPSKK